jgi:hypothetical protein
VNVDWYPFSEVSSQGDGIVVIVVSEHGGDLEEVGDDYRDVAGGGRGRWADGKLMVV